MNPNIKLIIASILFTSYMICNWLIDIWKHWAYAIEECTNNGFIKVCNTNLAGHLAWYLSIIIVLILFIFLLCEIKNIKTNMG